MAAILRDSAVVVVVVLTRPRTIPLAMITMRNAWVSFTLLYGIGAVLGGQPELHYKCFLKII